MPAPPLARCAPSTDRRLPRKSPHDADLAVVQQRLRAVRVVQRKHRGLRKDVARAERRRMLRVALELRRTPLVALREHALCDAAERHRCGIKQRAARHEILRLPDVRRDVLIGLARARAQARQRQRRAHQLEEIAPPLDRILVVAPADGLLRKFPFEEMAKLRRLGQLFQAPPILAPVRAVQLRPDGGDIELPARGPANQIGRGHIPRAPVTGAPPDCICSSLIDGKCYSW